MRTLFAALSCGCLAIGCATDSGVQPAPQASMPSTQTAPAARGPVVFADLPTFDRQLAQTLSGTKDPVVITSADRITLRQMPPRLEKWLAAVDEGGGRIEMQSADPGEMQARSLGLVMALIGAIREARALAQQQQYAEARQFDAKIYYRLDAGGDRVLERIELTRRQR